MCEKCFDADFDGWSRREFERVPAHNSLHCEECGNTPARFSEDTESGMCDACAAGRYEMEKGFMQSYGENELEADLPDEIIPHQLLLGPMTSSIDADMLRILGVRNILVCGLFLPFFHDKATSSVDIRYHRLPISDSIDEDITRYLPSACQFIDDCVAKGEVMLIHCQAGISRSASVVIAWLMHSKGWSYDEAFMFTKRKRPCIRPNFRFENDLRNIWAAQLDQHSN